MIHGLDLGSKSDASLASTYVFLAPKSKRKSYKCSLWVSTNEPSPWPSRSFNKY